MRRTCLAASACAVAVATVIAGCAGVPGPRRPARPALTSHAGAVSSGKVTTAGPLSGSRPQAAQFAQRLLGAVTVPAGAKPVPAGQEPAGLRIFGGGGPPGGAEVSPFRLCWLPVSMGRAVAFARAHLPAVVRNPGWGVRLGTGGKVVLQHVTAQARTVPAGLEGAFLTYAVVPRRDGTSVLQVSAQVTWYPARPAAEDFAAASFSAVTFTGPVRGRTVTRTFTARTVIGQVVSLLDAMHVSTAPWPACGMAGSGDGTEVELHPLRGRGQPVYAAFRGCAGYQVQLGGTPEPALGGADSRSAPSVLLDALTGRLLGA
jgi:hypothetical protein